MFQCLDLRVFRGQSAFLHPSFLASLSEYARQGPRGEGEEEEKGRGRGERGEAEGRRGKGVQINPSLFLNTVFCTFLQLSALGSAWAGETTWVRKSLSTRPIFE